MAETDVEQGTSANGAAGKDEQIAPQPEAPQTWTDTSARPAASEVPTADHRRAKLIACAALVGGGAFAAIRKTRRRRAQSHGRRWPAVPAMLTRTGRSRRKASSGHARKRRCR